MKKKPFNFMINIIKKEVNKNKMDKLILSEEFLRMQRLAGIITESQFKNMKEAIVNTVSDNLSDIFDEKT